MPNWVHPLKLGVGVEMIQIDSPPEHPDKGKATESPLVGPTKFIQNWSLNVNGQLSEGCARESLSFPFFPRISWLLNNAPATSFHFLSAKDFDPSSSSKMASLSIEVNALINTSSKWKSKATASSSISGEGISLMMMTPRKKNVISRVSSSAASIWP
ncbi:hypothetical protein ACH5RR_018598 [Cinchona calisaya]|uniref:Uncharacterized protein n=1 Tax=Cinchona calisaya TaxID=153742 RepID=A0ABD2ZME4_9GENT